MGPTFITLEGPDGSGKSTQAVLLAERLRQMGLPVVLTREPGGTSVGRKLREILLDPDVELSVMTEVLLMAADRAQHVQEVIKPALENNMVVVCDRYVDSSLAYQGFGLLGEMSQVKAINEAAIEGVWPDLTILLDVEPEVGLRRHRQAASEAGRSACSGRTNGLDRIEQRDLKFHQRVRDGYHVLTKLYAQRFVVIDTTGLEIETVAQKVWKAAAQRLRIAHE
ncbi:MAG: dTMP kinase [Firmicutes bacterium]|jgi:dTMP kinase|nr:dTMP kinase [Bacillota bacterium]